MDCPVAQAADVLGDRWTLLIIHHAFLGCRRFTTFQARLGIARNVLAARLDRLVEAGILEKVTVAGAHHAYLLTASGRALQPIRVAMAQWGERYRPNPDGARLIFIDRATGRPIAPLALLSQDGRILSGHGVKTSRVRAMPR